MYTVDYFLQKFEAIPEEEWTVRKFKRPGGRKCALGHCGMDNNWEHTAESAALSTIFRNRWNGKVTVVDVNDNNSEFMRSLGINGGTPKQRILQALRIIKEQ